MTRPCADNLAETLRALLACLDGCLSCHAAGMDRCTVEERARAALAAYEAERMGVDEGRRPDGDGTDRLCRALYGRDAEVRDWLGGSEARMLHDAADRLAERAQGPDWRALAGRLAARVDRRAYYCLDEAGREDVDRALSDGPETKGEMR